MYTGTILSGYVNGIIHKGGDPLHDDYKKYGLAADRPEAPFFYYV